MKRKKKTTKYIFITGGVVSSLGKGITAASIALLLSRRGYQVRVQKLDPYLNVDAGTMSPYQHGEVYVTEDGAEADLDLGHYERFGIPCSLQSNYTTGRIYSSVIARERAGEYLGKTVQVIPHITDEIKKAIYSMGTKADIVITEIGGTAGDIESLPFLEAIRQFRHEIGRKNGVFIHLTLVPYIKAAGEMKTKPSQQSIGILRSIGIIPDILIGRCERPLKKEHREKIALFCNVEEELVFEACDVKHSIYELPIEFSKQDLDIYILELLKLHVHTLRLNDWQQMLETLIRPQKGTVEIALVGKYMKLKDAYKSVLEALVHGGIANSVKVKFRCIESEDIEKKGTEILQKVDAILVPGGFGTRGIEGKIATIRHAREKKIPFFGICLGMQCAIIEFVRHKCDLKQAMSSEFNSSEHVVVDLLEEQKNVKSKGGTMRLGNYPCKLQKNSLAQRLYQKNKVLERHRHRYEVNNKYIKTLNKNGMLCTGMSPDGDLVEIVELKNHPWFLACQYHPEFNSTPLNPHPLFKGFIQAAIHLRQSKKTKF